MMRWEKIFFILFFAAQIICCGDDKNSQAKQSIPGVDTIEKQNKRGNDYINLEFGISLIDVYAKFDIAEEIKDGDNAVYINVFDKVTENQIAVIELRGWSRAFRPDGSDPDLLIDNARTNRYKLDESKWNIPADRLIGYVFETDGLPNGDIIGRIVTEKTNADSIVKSIRFIQDTQR